MKKNAWLIPVILLAIFSYGATDELNNAGTSPICMNKEEMKLYHLLNEYRASKGLKSVELSASLCKVAQIHLDDLIRNKPDRKSDCNAHSWSDKGNWTPCCYTADHAQASCMWKKPQELTNYKGYGYEIAFGSSDPDYDSYIANANDAISAWKKSAGHNAVIISEGIWADHPWKAMGMAVRGGFSCVWFGEETDLEPMPSLCE